MDPGDIVQVKDNHERFANCLVVVDKVKSWGIVGYVQLPKMAHPLFTADGRPVFTTETLQAPIRLEHAEFTATRGKVR